MRLEQLQYLIEVSKHRSLTTAAEQLYVTQPALSRAIKALEQELNSTLLYRTPNGVQLTASAKTLMPLIKSIVLQVENLKQAAQLQNTKNRIFQDISFSIVTSPAIVDTYLPLVLRAYKEDFPLAEINISLTETYELTKMTQNPTEHLLLLIKSQEGLNDMSNTSPLNGQILLTENYSAVVRRDSEIANKRFISLKDAITHKLVFGNNGIDFHEFFYQEIKEKVSLDILLKSNNLSVIKEMILTYDALFIASNTLIMNSDFSDAFKIIPLRNKQQSCQANIYAFYQNSNPAKIYIEAFLEKFRLFSSL